MKVVLEVEVLLTLLMDVCVNYIQNWVVVTKAHWKLVLAQLCRDESLFALLYLHRKQPFGGVDGPNHKQYKKLPFDSSQRQDQSYLDVKPRPKPHVKFVFHYFDDWLLLVYPFAIDFSVLKEVIAAVFVRHFFDKFLHLLVLLLIDLNWFGFLLTLTLNIDNFFTLHGLDPLAQHLCELRRFHFPKINVHLHD